MANHENRDRDSLKKEDPGRSAEREKKAPASHEESEKSGSEPRQGQSGRSGLEHPAEGGSSRPSGRDAEDSQGSNRKKKPSDDESDSEGSEE